MGGAEGWLTPQRRAPRTVTPFRAVGKTSRHRREELHHKPGAEWRPAVTFVGVRLADCIAQCRVPLAVPDPATGELIHLSSAADCAEQVVKSPLRFVLSDNLTRLCGDLAYSRGARNLPCADLLHVPAEALWIEWCNEPWQGTLERYGFPASAQQPPWQRAGRRGALILSTPDGRRGKVRTLWSGAAEPQVLASSVEAYFDFDTQRDEEPVVPDGDAAPAVRVYDGASHGEDLLARCFRFRYERTWWNYYRRAVLSSTERMAIMRHVLGTIAIDIPILLAFLLLLGSRANLPRMYQGFDRLNHLRLRSGKAPLLDHVEVHAPLLPQYQPYGAAQQPGARRSPRLHHVRGHLVRRGSSLFWRVPHMRGSVRCGAVRSRTVVWTFDEPAVGRDAAVSAGPRQ